MLNIQKNQYIGTQKQQGFTLIELMVVIVILGVLAALVVPNVMGNKERADTQKAVSDIVSLESALDMYKLDNNRYPSTEQGLKALVTKPTVQPEPIMTCTPSSPVSVPVVAALSEAENVLP